MTQAQQLQTILAGIAVAGRGEDSYEDASLYADLGVAKYIHGLLIKPISYWFSSRILRNSILDAIGDVKGKSVLDVSCGDDPTIIKIAKRAKKTYANDIVLESMLPNIEKSKKENVKIHFSQGNLLDINMKKVDVVLCKNTLHHMNTAKQIEKSLRKLKRLGKKIIIMDIENPKLSRLARLWNAYYVFMLKDQGGFFIDYSQFCRVLQVVFADRHFETKKVKTIKGNYMLAVISK